MKTLLFSLILISGLVAQQPTVSIPTSEGAWTLFDDGSAKLLDLSDGQIIVRQTLTTSPQTFHAEWTDRTNTKHAVDTNCANITIEECLRRHLDAITKYQAAFPPQ